MTSSRTYTVRGRDLFRSLTAVVTGLATFGTVAGTGAATVASAQATQRRDVARAQAAALEVERRTHADPLLRVPQPRLTIRARAQRVVVRTRVVQQAAQASFAAAPSVSAWRAPTVTPRSPAPRNPPPAPAPAPAPSSGS